MIHRYLIIFFLILFANLCFPNPANKPSFKTDPPLSGIYYSAPTSFIENKGQIIDQDGKPNSGVLFILNTPGMNVQLRRGGFSYDVYSPRPCTPPPIGGGDGGKGVTRNASPDSTPLILYHRIDIDLLNASPNPTIIPSDPASDYFNYFTSSAPPEGIKNVRQYAKITYKEVYPGIDLEFITNKEHGYKYNFVIHPGANINDIQLRINGPDHISFTHDTLKFATRFGDIEELIPASYYMVNDSKTSVNARFLKISKGIYGFEVDKTIPQNSEVVIDPTSMRLWGTYYGGTANDEGWCVAMDSLHNVFMSGETMSNNNIATAGAYQTWWIGGITWNGFLVKFDAHGVRQWGTYFCGDTLHAETLYNCAVDRSGNVYIAGTTTSDTGISTPGSHQTVYGGGNYDVYLAKFSTYGTRLWATYYGGSGGDEMETYNKAIATDRNCNVFIAGQTGSLNNIATPGAYEEVPANGNSGGFLAKFDSSGVLLWGTYYGGTVGATFTALATDSIGNVYAAGITGSSDSIASQGAFQYTYGGGSQDGFLVAFSPAGQRLWGTYYGGELYDWPFQVTIDHDGFLYLVGYTNSTTGMSSTGSYQETLSGQYDGFIAKFTNLGQRVWGSYYGGLQYDGVYSCSVSGNGDIFFAGSTGSIDKIATPNSFMPAYGGGSGDGFLVKFNANGARQWCTYFGSMGSDAINHCFYVQDDTIYFAGNTSSFDNIATSDGHQTTKGDPYTYESDGFLEKFIECWPIDTAGPISGPTHVCKNSAGINYFIPALPHAVNYIWTFPAGASIVNGSGTNNILVNFGATATSGNIWVKGLNKCGDPGDSASLHITINPDPVPLITGPDNTCAGPGKVYSTDPGKTNYQWSTSTGGFITNGGGISDNSATITWNNVGVQHVYVNYADANGCTAPTPTDFMVTVTASPAVDVTISTPSNTVCEGTQVIYTATPTNGGTVPSYAWKVNGTTAGIDSPTYSYTPVNGDQIFCILTSNATCSSNNPDTSNTIIMTVNPPSPVSVIIATFDNPVCAGSSATFSVTPTNGGSSPSYLWKVNGGGVYPDSPIMSYIPVNGDIVTCVLTSSNTVCVSNNPATSNAITMVVDPLNPVSVSINTPDNPFCQGSTVNFTATPTNGGTTPFYQWKVNGVGVGSNNPVYSYIPGNGDLVTCVLNSNIACPTGNPATSNTIAMVENTVNPVSITITTAVTTVCSGTSVTFTATLTNGGTTPAYQWKVNGMGVSQYAPTMSFVPNNGDQVKCILTSNANCATGNPATSNTITMTVNQNMAVSVSITASVNPVCSGLPVTYTATPVNGGSSPVYQWKVNGINIGTNNTTYQYIPVNGDLVNCTLTSNLTCTTGNPATSNTITMNVATSPVVTFTRCNDSITTLNAQPFRLKGGIPLGGTYSGPGVTNGIFYPALAGVGMHQITYSYSNAALCTAFASRSLVISQSSLGVCGNNLTDIRDNKVYPTVQIGTQCWLSANLNYGTMIPGNISQRDNCINEKYCLNDITGNCQLGTVYYQWDELMQYDETLSTQGLCPPGWHVPTETDWNTLFAGYINSAFAAWPLLSTGYSGFNATLSGTRHMNQTSDWTGFATFFWSSTSHGAIKAWSHGMNDTDPSVSRYPAFRSNAFSVRCLKD
ncbi:MAG: SBBP repeat-containing protein [Bacteroidetes bacterium]|nr:SBBP repeat-containing protein [Bacteroidota bacterium]